MIAVVLTTALGVSVGSAIPRTVLNPLPTVLVYDHCQ